MFTGLIRAIGKVHSSIPFGKDGRRLTIDIADLAYSSAGQIVAGSSIAVNGVCLTVAKVEKSCVFFDAVAETLSRSNLYSLRSGTCVNLELALRMGDPVDGHWVLGHVDGVAKLLSRVAEEGNTRLRFSFPKDLEGLIAEKGSVAIDGVSVTVASVDEEGFVVAIIPETLKRTTLGKIIVGAEVNIEADALARYAARWISVRNRGATLTEEKLKQLGFT